MRNLIYFMVACCALPSFALAQSQPHVDDIFKKLDADADGLLSKDEVKNSGRFERQFSRWDTDRDGSVSKQEVIAFRAKFGIAADGSSLKKDKPAPSRRLEKTPEDAGKFSIPDVASLTRVDKNTRLNRQFASNSQFVLATPKHAVAGQSYVILTDHNQPKYLGALTRLSKHHSGTIINVNDLAALHQDQDELISLRNRLRTLQVKYLAIAPRIESFRENTVLGVWELVTTLDNDSLVDCYPAFLVASNEASFARLIDQSIQHVPIANQAVQPLAINQVQNSRETRSLQKSGILRKLFASHQLSTPVVSIYGPNTDNAPRLEGDQVYNLNVKSRRNFMKQFPAKAQAAMNDANLIVMHGHGIPGMSCSMDIDGIANDMSGKILLSGSCFSACPKRSDLPSMSRAPGGYEVESRDAFVLRAIDNGAIAAFGHQRLSSGFPHLFPVLEAWTEGQTVGQAYQQLINGLIELQGAQSGDFVIHENQKQQRRLPQQRFLYVVIGDPALQPLMPFGQTQTHASR